MRAAQAAADDLKHMEGNELRDQMERIQALINAANAQQDMGNRVVGTG